MRVGVTLACSECKQRNYTTTRDKKKQGEKLEKKKYCRFCNTHTVHKEIK
ncbi:MAG: 50S ribosomal protein L33 [Syntrophomonas sp.]|nr:50S ribosomal protein L33 [Syntrophomonas sp.]MDD2509576.1 50S ribosomal protein L33 [Syntrophomonas sp.]MDD3879370.1 50S ribosomal protein L33 [Syntrophomonas sp.]MDD4626223.1 50S ribosomal protein L33 [Syntrophomonas sp.]